VVVAVGVGGGKQVRARLVTQIGPRAPDRGVADRETYDALLAQGGIELRLRRQRTPAERTMQAAKQTDQYRALAAQILQRDLALARDGVQHNVRCAVARLERPIDVRLKHAGLLASC